ncbi:MAG: transposase [Saprospiraceae bacterium]|nr:transposase [Saprospiraceae bacterium]
MSKFRNKYRIESVRLEGYDYGRNGAYFITICTNNRQHFFGEIRESEFFPTDLGNLAEKFWLEIPDKFPFVELGNFVVMPDHTHGILVIDKNDPVETRLIADQPVDQINGGFAGIKNPMFHENISRIIRWYKGRCAYEMRKLIQVLPGNPVFMTILFAMPNRLKTFKITSKTIQATGQKTN